MKRKVYGLPYKGNKSRLAERILSLLPPAEHLIDLFAGGGAITHCAMMGEKYRHIHLNDINPMMVYAFQMALNGYFDHTDHFVTREEFYRLRDTDPYAAICFSFGNDTRTYAYGRNRMGKPQSGRVEHRERIRRIRKMAHTAHTCSLTYSASDYREVYIPSHSVIYADIPYQDTRKYPGPQFDYPAFYEWASTQTQPLFVSSYSLPAEHFIPIQEWESLSTINAQRPKRVVERIFIPCHQQDLVYPLIGLH